MRVYMEDRQENSEFCKSFVKPYKFLEKGVLNHISYQINDLRMKKSWSHAECHF